MWDHAASGPHGDVRLRIYEPRVGPRSGAGLVWMHGGAFVGDDLDMPEADVVSGTRESLSPVPGGLAGRDPSTIMAPSVRLR